MKTKLLKIARNEKTSKAGKPYVSVGIKIAEYPDKWINGFGNKSNSSWTDGDVVELEVVEKNGYLNFETPKKEDELAGKIEELTTLCLRIYECVKKKGVADDVPFGD